MLTKSKIIDQLDKMPNSFTIDEFIDRLIFLEKIENGLKQSRDRHTISKDELNLKVKEWQN